LAVDGLSTTGENEYFCRQTYYSITRQTLYGIALVLLCSCSATRRSTSTTPAETPSIRTAPAGTAYKERVVGQPLTNPGYTYVNIKGLNIEFVDSLNFKYAQQLDIPVELITDPALYHFIDDWWGTPYHLGGTSRAGIDCSAFCQTLEESVFHLTLPRTSREQYLQCHKVPVPELQEGDLVFFGTKKGITHVGVYLTNNKFVHASTSGGVMISDLGDEYWSRRFRGAGRMPG
jgi:cell wall-associated NlpC family hydrolase